MPSLAPSEVYIPSSTPSLTPTVSPQPTIGPFTWDLELVTPGYLEEPPIADGVQKFIANYNMSDRYYGIEVFKADCSTASTGLILDSTIDSKAGGDNSMEAIFIYNQSVIQASNLWTANTTGGDVDFCIKVSLYSNETNGILFNFVETTYKIQVDLTTGFSTSVDVVRTAAGDGGLETIDIDENITAYQCNDTFHEISSPPALTQGEALQICVETEDGSAFEVASFKDVKISQNGTKAFDYVTNFADSYWASSSCKDTNTPTSVCKVKMQLLGDYFADSDPADLTVEGVVKMDYLGRRRRVLRDVNSDGTDLNGLASNDQRELQEDQGGNAKFSLIAPLSSETNENDTGLSSPEASTTEGSSATASMVSLAAVLMSAMMSIAGYHMEL